MKQEIARESPRAANVKMQVSRIPFSAIPHQSPLFIEYQRDPHSLKRFYPNAVERPSQLASFVPGMLDKYSTDRGKLCDALDEVNAAIGAAPKTLDNIRLLRSPGCVAVVTGQQAGLFTGPLYTVYKALSAIRMAEVLSQNGTTAVPVFWAATEDHDFDEVSNASFIDKTGALVNINYLPDRYIKNSPVGNVVIDERIADVIDRVFANLPGTEFSDEVRALLTASWKKGARFGDAFLRTLVALLGKYGLVFIDPMNDRIKKLAAPIYVDAVRRSDEIVENIIKRDRELVDTGFHAQVVVEPDYFPLFWHDDNGERTALRKTGEGRYRTRGGPTEFTRAELENLAAADPKKFSPGVMLRPVVQDFLLPTVCYLGGAAEIGYFAQNSAVYDVLGRPVTPILHRQGFTVVDSKHQRVFDKLGLDFLSLFKGLDETLLGLAETLTSAGTAKLFAEVEQHINTELNRLDQHVSQIDPTLADNLAKRRRKIIYHIAALRRKTLLAQARKDETLTKRLKDLFTALLPNSQLQERSINVFTYLNKFGPNFIDWIYASVDVENKDHQIINL